MCCALLSRLLREGVTATEPCSQQRCAASTHTCPGLLTRSEPVSQFLRLCLRPSVFPALLSFPKDPAFSRRARSRAASVLSFLPLVMFQDYFALGPTCSYFWPSKVSMELSSSIVFIFIHFFKLSVF